jgi:DNA-directed RNA polymerase III subunit RPC1
LTPEEFRDFRQKMRRVQHDQFRRRNLLKLIAERCKKAKSCHYCLEKNGTVKRLNNKTLKIHHEKFHARKDATEVLEFHQKFNYAVSQMPDIKSHLSRAHEDLNPQHVLGLLRRITDADCELLDLDARHGRPENLVMTHVAVPPPCIRPSVDVDEVCILCIPVFLCFFLFSLSLSHCRVKEVAPVMRTT